ncbi:hypothetical protein [Halobacterium noricense]|uniref:hypothetical protein n=1 Tax=Halobacterium noricense TaxID=223182 RepID=UPI001E321650|nr:hypothetical protein [Halobacterium noricense]UHH27302.1 hypothetical protein LT974_17550 [Halobacterium noricense]
MQRRRFLTAAGTASILGLAGCSSSGDSSTDPPTATSAESTPTRTAESTPDPTTTQPTTRSVDELKDDAVEVEYDELFRNFEQYAEENTPIYYPYGGIYQTLYDEYEGGIDHLQLQVSTNDQAWQGDIVAMWGGDKRYLENDVLELWGRPVDLYEYTTVNDDVRTIPRITMVDAQLINED